MPWSRCFAGALVLLRVSWRRGSGREPERRERDAGKEERGNGRSHLGIAEHYRKK